MEPEFKKLVRREPKWLVSFADLMALLLALFVMLLSFAEVDSDSFKRNAGSISQSFFHMNNAQLDGELLVHILQSRFDPFRLPESQFAAACTDDDSILLHGIVLAGS